MTKGSLICSVDNVCANFHLAFSKLIKEHINPNAPILMFSDEVKSWNWAEWYPVNEEQLKEAWTILENTENFWRKLITLDVYGIRKLYQLRNDLDIYFVTNRVETVGHSAMRQTQMWLEESGFPSANVVVTDKKEGFAQFLGNVKYVIDDKPKYYSLNYEILGIVKYPYNITKTTNPHIRHFDDLYDFVGAVQETL